MSRLLRQTSIEVLIDHAYFRLDDEQAHLGGTPDFTDNSKWLIPTYDGLVVCSASGRYHCPTVRLELWDDEPFEINKPWETQRDTTVTLSTGTLEVYSALATEPTARFPLAGPGRYRVRAYSAGRDEIHETHLADDDDGPIRGVEKYLIQFWRN